MQSVYNYFAADQTLSLSRSISNPPFNLSTLVITILMMLVQRFGFESTNNLKILIDIFFSCFIVCLILYWYCKEKFSWLFMGFKRLKFKLLIIMVCLQPPKYTKGNTLLKYSTSGQIQGFWRISRSNSTASEIKLFIWDKQLVKPKMKNKNSKPLASNLSFKIDMTEFKGLVTLLLPRPTRFCNLH